MKKKIAILGSTGSIGKNLLNIIKKNQNFFDVNLLSANRNYKKVLNQAIKFDVKNIIIHDIKTFNYSKKFFLQKKINIFNTVQEYKIKNKFKFDYTMVGIIGFFGLKPTLDIIEITKKIAIANKESIICGWNLIQKKLKKSNTKFLPIDSEHFSIDELIKNKDKDNIEKIYLTASGGPFLNKKLSAFKKIKVKEAIKHPTWQMGEKISIDSATLVNKVYEIIEAKKIFNVDYSKLDILIQPTSYIHSIVKFYGGTIHYLAHNPSMTIPIFNSLIENSRLKKKLTSNINYDLLNNLEIKEVPFKKFPIKKILKTLPKKDSLFETVLVSANDTLVQLYLSNKIKFNQIHLILYKVLTLKKFNVYKKKTPKNIREIAKLYEYVRLKTESLSVV